MNKPFSAFAGIFVLIWDGMKARKRRAGRHPPAESLEAGHETRDWNVTTLFWLGVLFFWGAVLMYIALYGLHYWFTRATQKPTPVSQGVAASRHPPPLPHLEVDNSSELIRHRARQYLLLHSYSWVDKSAGIVRIPIDEAIQRYGHAEK